MSVSTNPWLKMAQNNAWANATLYDAIIPLGPQGFAAPRPGFFGSLLRTMNHIYEVDLYYSDALEEGGLGRSVYRREDIADPAELARLQAGSDARFITFCDTTAPAALDQPRRTERETETVIETVGALVLHLVQHQIHHRGQAHVMLSDAGIDPPQLDDFYLEFGRVPSAAPYWSA